MRRLAAALIMAVWLCGCLAPASLPSDVRASVERQLADAGLSFTRVAASPDFVTGAALSSPGATDWVVDFNEAQGPYCGAGGCPLQVWVKGPKEVYRLAFDQQVLGWRAGIEDGVPILRVKLHGALCGRSAIEDCAQTFRWSGGAGGLGHFIPLAQNHAGPLVQAIRLDPNETPTPVRYAVKAYEAACTRAGGVPEMSQSVRSLPDLTGDRARELLFDASTAWCWTRDGLAPVRPDCKAGSCNSRLFSPSGAGWREVQLAPALREELDHGGARAATKVDGRSSDRTS